MSNTPAAGADGPAEPRAGERLRQTGQLQGEEGRENGVEREVRGRGELVHLAVLVARQRPEDRLGLGADLKSVMNIASEDQTA